MMQNPAALHKREGSVTFCKAYFYELNYYVLSCAKFAVVFHKLLQKIFSTFYLLIMYNGGTEIFLRPFLRGNPLC